MSVSGGIEFVVQGISHINGSDAPWCQTQAKKGFTRDRVFEMNVKKCSLAYINYLSAPSHWSL